VRLNRRDFCAALAISTAAQACSREPDEPARATLVRLLGLTETQAAWLDSLSPAQQVELRDALVSRSPNTERHTIELLMKVFGRRERLFAYVGYPELPRIGACDGLLRE
jgi:hypothetical protein